MFAFKILSVVFMAHMLQFALSEVEEKEENHGIYHKEEECKDAPVVRLSDGYERFLKIYEEAIKESKEYEKSSEDEKNLLLADLAKMRKMLGKPENELTTEEQELADWVKELEGLSKEFLRITLRAMIAGNLYYSYNPEDKYKPANVQAI